MREFFTSGSRKTKIVAGLIIVFLAICIVSYFNLKKENNVLTQQLDYFSKENTRKSDLYSEGRQQRNQLEDNLNKCNINLETYKKENKILYDLVPEDKRFYTFSNDEIGISFTYPIWFGEIRFGIRDGEKGKKFTGTFSNVALEFGGVTVDFEEGRDSWFTDYEGTGKFLPEYPVVKVLDVEGGQVTIEKGQGDLMPGNILAEGDYGALVKLNGKMFKGLSFLSGETYGHENDDNKITLKDFENMLKTLIIK